MVSVALLFEEKMVSAASPFGAKVISKGLDHTAQISLLVLKPNSFFFFNPTDMKIC